MTAELYIETVLTLVWAIGTIAYFIHNPQVYAVLTKIRHRLGKI